MTKDMLYLSRDNIRSHNDGRRTSATSQGAWIEPVQRQAVKADLSLCCQVWRQANLSCAAQEVATADKGGSSTEDQLNDAGILPATPRMPIPLIPLEKIGIPMVTLPVDDFTHGDRHVSSVPLHAFL